MGTSFVLMSSSKAKQLESEIDSAQGSHSERFFAEFNNVQKGFPIVTHDVEQCFAVVQSSMLIWDGSANNMLIGCLQTVSLWQRSAR